MHRKDYGMVRHWKRKKSALKTLILKKKKDTDTDHIIS